MPTPEPAPSLQHARQPVIDAIAQAFALYGWPEITGRLFAQLFLDGSPHSQDELADIVAMSKATISTNLRTLETLHLVHRVAAPATKTQSEGGESGGRPRVYYQAERDFMKVAQELLRHNARREAELIERGLAESRRRLHDLAAQPNGTAPVAIQDDLLAIDKIEGYQRWGRRLLWVLQSAERMQRFVTGFWRADDEDEGANG